MSRFSKQEAIDFILSQSKIVWDLYSNVYNCQELPLIEIQSKSNRIAGTAYRSGKKVTFNLAFCMVEGEEFIRTIRHELAHIIQFRLFPSAPQAHGPEFRSILESLGFDSSTYHKYDTLAAKSIAKKTKVLLIDSISVDEM